MKLSKFALAASGLCISLSSATRTPPVPIPTVSESDPPARAADIYTRAIAAFDGEIVDPASYPATLAGFQQYLAAAGVHHVTAEELTRPNHPAVAARLGFEMFLPPQSWWPRGAALALLIDQLRRVAREPVHIRNWWRPPAYNSNPLVGGAKYGDHPTANAVDLDYASVGGRMRAERWLRSLDRADSWLKLSLGLGATTTHVGIGSPRGRREWHYRGWRPAA
jgi:hypothetical protein